MLICSKYTMYTSALGVQFIYTTLRRKAMLLYKGPRIQVPNEQFVYKTNPSTKRPLLYISQLCLLFIADCTLYAPLEGIGGLLLDEGEVELVALAQRVRENNGRFVSHWFGRVRGGLHTEVSK